MRRLILGLLGAVMLIMLLVYGALRSERVVRALVLPRIGDALEVEIDVAGIYVLPFSSVDVEGLVIRKDAQEILRADRARLSYDWKALFEKVFRIHAVTFDRARVRLARSADGVWNFGTSETRTETSDRKSKPWTVEVQTARIAESAIELLMHTGEDLAAYHVSDLGLILDNYAPHASLTYAINGTGSLHPTEHFEASVRRMESNGVLELDGDSQLVSATVQAKCADVMMNVFERQVPQGSLFFEAGAAKSGDTWTIKQAALRQTMQDGVVRSSLQVAGEVDLDRGSRSFDLDAALQTLDLRLLNMILPPGTRMSISSGVAEGAIQLTKQGTKQGTGSSIRGNGTLEIQDLGLYRTKVQDLNLSVLPRVRVDIAESRVEWRPSSIIISQGGEALGEIQTSGGYDLSTGAGALQLTVAALSGQALRMVSPQGALIPDGSLHADGRIEFDGKGLRWDRFFLEARQDDESILKGRTSGSASIPLSTINMAAEIDSLRDRAVVPFFPRIPFPKFDAQGQIRASGEIDLEELDASAQLSIRTGMNRAPPFLTRLSVGVKKNKGELSASLQPLVIGAGSGAESGQANVLDAHVEVRGKVSDRSAELKGEVQAGQVDLTELMRLSQIFEEAAGEQEASPRARFEAGQWLTDRQVGDIKGAKDSEDTSASIAIDLALKGRSVRWREMHLSDIEGELRYSKQQYHVNLPRLTLNGSPGSLSGILSNAPEGLSFQFETGLEALSLRPFHRSLQPEVSTVIEGDVRDIWAQGRGKGRNWAEIRSDFEGGLEAKFGNVYLPAELGAVTPFNILFVPFRALAEVGRLIPPMLIPNPLEVLTTNVAAGMQEAQQLKIREGEISLRANTGIVELSNLVIGTDLLPAVYLSGEIGLDGKIMLSSGLELIGLRVPLPIGGSLERPVPDISRFATELLKALGYNISTMPANILNQLGRVSPDRVLNFLFRQQEGSSDDRGTGGTGPNTSHP